MAEREWMYTGWSRTQPPSNDWIDKTNQFLARAFSMPNLVEDGTIKCPCAVCRNCVRHKRFTVEMHLCRVGFKEDYIIWTSHGEGLDSTYVEGGHDENFAETDHMDEMLASLVGDHPPPIDEQPPAYARAFYRMVQNVDQLVHENTSHSSLSGMARLLALKAQYNMSIAHFEANLELIHELLPPKSKLPKDFYQSKKLFEGLGMAYVKIDVCYNNCMLYYKDNQSKDKCDVCGMSRYEEGNSRVPRKVLRYLPITDRLQRLYLHKNTAKLLRSHKPCTSGKMVHPCDGEAWPKFDEDFPAFASDPRNVRLAFATDGFTPFGFMAAPYSCWPVFVTPFNFPPCTIMKSEYIFLSLVVPGPEHPGKKLGILMQPLIDELVSLWEGVDTWDASLKKTFKMRAAYLWSVHDFPAYGNFAGWSTHGRLACPVCLSDSKAFTLRHGHKACWFDCHRRFLPIDHEFRFQNNAFRKDTVVLDEAPWLLTGEEIFAQMSKFVGEALAATAKSHRSSASTAAYQCMVDEYEQLKERNDALEQTNKKLNENNEILIEENGVNRELMLRIYEDLKKQPPADLMNRLANLDARRHQVSASSHAATNSLEMLSNANDIVTDDDDDDYNEMDDSNSYDDDNDICDDFDEDDVSDDLRGSEDGNISSSHEEEDGSDANGADISDN